MTQRSPTVAGSARRRIAAPTVHPRLLALLLYLCFSAILFGRAMTGRFSTVYLGYGIDQSFFIWCLVWWPYAIAHHLNPFVTRLIFAPGGFNLAWSTSIPLLSLLAFPLTATAGGIATFNLLCLAFPALSAWTAFLLCHRLTGRFWPALAGGYVFGFSSFMLAQMYGGHVSLLAVFLIPAAVCLVLARLENRITRARFGVAIAVLVTAQFLIATELAASITMFGAIALIAAWAAGGRELRRPIERLVPPIFLAYLAAAALLSPYLYYLLAGFRTLPIYSPSRHSTDLLNFVVPTRTVALGAAFDLFRRVSAAFSSNLSEQGGYVGAPLLALAVWFCWERRRSCAARLIAVMVAVVIVAAMGPWLHIGGRSYFKLPWSLLHRAPFIDQALPLRFTVYLSLLLAAAAALWLADGRRAAWTRAIAGVLLVASLFPNPAADTWSTPGAVAPPPPFFTSGAYRRYLAPGEIVATLPYARSEADAAMLWQALSGMYFRLAGGYPPLSPLSFLRWPIVRSANESATIPDPPDQWKAFAANHDVTAVMVGELPTPPNHPSIAPITAALGAPVASGHGITLYRVAPAALAPYKGLDWIRMEQLADAQRFDSLLLASERYLASGADPAALSPANAAKMGLLPATWLTGPTRAHDYELYMRVRADRPLTIGIMGTCEGILPLIGRYRAYARDIRFNAPERRAPRASLLPPATDYYPFMMSFDPAGLADAAALARAKPPRLELSGESHSHVSTPTRDCTPLAITTRR